MARPSKRIRKHSPFARLRNMSRVGQVANCSEDSLCEEVDIIDRFEIVPLPDNHPARRFLGFSQNDAEVLCINFRRSDLLFSVSHYDVGRLACELWEGRVDWQWMRMQFPVTMSFNGLTELLILRRVREGVVQKLRTSLRDLQRSVFDVIQIECVHYSAECERYIIELNGKGSYFKRSRKYPQSYHNDYAICVECESLTVQADYRAGWERVFSGRYVDILDRFEAVWPVPHWSMPDFAEWIEKNRLGD